MWKVASENLRFENFLLDCYGSKNFRELKTAFGQNKSILSCFSRFFIITPRKLAKQYFLSFFFQAPSLQFQEEINDKKMDVKAVVSE